MYLARDHLNPPSPSNTLCSPSTFRVGLAGGAGMCPYLEFHTCRASSAPTAQLPVCDVGFSLCGLVAPEAVGNSKLGTLCSCQKASSKWGDRLTLHRAPKPPGTALCKGSAEVAAILFYFKLNCMVHPYPFQFLVSSHENRGNKAIWVEGVF